MVVNWKFEIQVYISKFEVLLNIAPFWSDVVILIILFSWTVHLSIYLLKKISFINKASSTAPINT